MYLLDLPTFAEDRLLKTFEEIHNYIYANEGFSPEQTLEEIIKILFIKIFDESQNEHHFFVTQSELEHLKQEPKYLKFQQRINHLFEKTKQNYQNLFDPEDRLRISLITLGFIIEKLQDISLINFSKDVKGLAFQKFLSHREKDGRGQFFTPEPIRDFCVKMIQPKPEETIIDPACGSGGFLLSALTYIQHNFPETDLKKIINQNLYGIDISKSIARIAEMQLLLEANTKVNIFCANSLENIDYLLPSDGFDIILTNPPFGTVGKITNRNILKQFDLGYKWFKTNNQYEKSNKIITGQTVEILFIERCLQLLKEGGRMAIVLPNGHLENSSLAYLRDYLKQKAKILAIINLPQETFIPFGTGVKTSLLFLKKETVNKNNNYQIFFGKVTKLGYQGNKNATPIYQKDRYGEIIRDPKGKLIVDENFSIVIEDYQTFLQEKNIETENSFSLKFQDLQGRFDYDLYSPENRKLMINLNQNALQLGDVCDIIKIKSCLLKKADFEVEYIELSDINTYGLEIINTTTCLVHQLPSRASYELQQGDIITAIAGNSVGTKKHATALVTEEFNGCICSNGFRVLRNFKIDQYFLLYFLTSELFLRQMFMYRTGAAIPNVSDQDLAKILISLPEQDTIKMISDKMKLVLELKQASKREFESLRYTLSQKVGDFSR
jgi:type I restriction enzyme M protein